MNKKFFIAWLVIFIVWMAGDFLVHGVLLKSDYMQLAKLYRSDAVSHALRHPRFGFLATLVNPRERARH